VYRARLRFLQWQIIFFPRRQPAGKRIDLFEPLLTQHYRAAAGAVTGATREYDGFTLMLFQLFNPPS